MALDRNWRESRKEEDRLRGKRNREEGLLSRSKDKLCHDP